MSKVVKLSKIRQLLAKHGSPDATFNAIVPKIHPELRTKFDRFYREKPLNQRPQHEIENCIAFILGYTIVEDDCRTATEKFKIWEDITKLV